MHVKAKQVAFLGILAAIVSICLIFSSIFEANTLFLLAFASFLVGVPIREFGLRLGFGFFAACIFLGLLLTPNKIYVLTYTGFSAYILWDEAMYCILGKHQFQKSRNLLFFFTKLFFFNILFLPVILFFPQILFPQNISTPVLIGIIAGGQLGWFIYDKAYHYFQSMVWGKFRNKIDLLH